MQCAVIHTERINAVLYLCDAAQKWKQLVKQCVHTKLKQQQKQIMESFVPRCNAAHAPYVGGA